MVSFDRGTVVVSQRRRRWLVQRVEDRGWDDYVAGRMPGPPEWGILPGDAPQIGSRVRLKIAGPTLSGTTFEEGELAVVTELRFMPVGSVRVGLRTLDGRRYIAIRPNDFEIA
jgi:hypothetical protein